MKKGTSNTTFARNANQTTLKPLISKTMIDINKVSRASDLINELDEKYAKPMAAYAETYKKDMGENPSQKQLSEYASHHNKAALLTELVAHSRQVNSWLAGMVHQVEELDTVLQKYRILKDGKIREVLVSQQRQELENIFEKLLAYIKPE